jgi:hypothetical protein
MDSETYEDVAELVEAGLKSGTSMQTIKECIGQVTLRKWLLAVGEKYQRKEHLRPLKRK